MVCHNHLLLITYISNIIFMVENIFKQNLQEKRQNTLIWWEYFMKTSEIIATTKLSGHTMIMKYSFLQDGKKRSETGHLKFK